MVMDYAKSATPIRTDSIKQTRPGGMRTAVVVVALIGVVVAAFLGGYQLGQHYKSEQLQVEAKRVLQQRFDQQAQEISDLQEKLVITEKKRPPPPAKKTSEVGELTFYNDLPNAKVYSNRDAATPKLKPKRKPKHPSVAKVATRRVERGVADIIAQTRQSAILTGRALQIQLASFAHESDAELLKQRVLLQGMISVVRPVMLSGKRNVFRVMVGPYPTMKQAMADKRRLHATLHLAGLIVRGDN
ncbi:MAG: SPOR domain-containing protein [Mariprofundales bacterium]|nr:SPOR domain-containing protein [Mariprofundales bacterium]